MLGEMFTLWGNFFTSKKDEERRAPHLAPEKGKGAEVKEKKISKRNGSFLRS